MLSKTLLLCIKQQFIQSNHFKSYIARSKMKIVLEPIVGCPLIPSVDLEDMDSIDNFHWFIGDHAIKKPKISFDEASQCGLIINGYDFVSTSFYYCPTENDLNKFIIAYVPSFTNEKIGKYATSPNCVKLATENITENLIFVERQKEFCKERLNGINYRILSYNVLANLYIKSSLSKKEQKDQYFPYCPKEFQSDNYRYPLLLKEIQGYNADLLFLQEVDVRFQKRYLIPFLKLEGYTPIFNCKENQVNEGLVIAFKNDRFSNYENNNYTAKISDLLVQQSNLDLVEFLHDKKEVYNIITSRPTIIQLIHFTCINNSKMQIIAANTHLYFDPLFEEVKLLQAVLCVRYIDEVIKKIKSSDKKQKIQVIFGGDFNFEPNSIGAKLLRNDIVIDEIEKEDKNIEVPFKFQCATGFPQYTNFTRAEGYEGFIGCLDYIWLYPQTKILKIIPMPDHQLITKHGALPSRIAPSDHLPIICELCIDDKTNND